MKWSTIIFIFLFYQCHLLIGQHENFEIEYPWSQDVKRLKADSLGIYWLHDSKDFYYYNGQQITPLGLGEILGKKKHDYNFFGDIIFSSGQLMFINDQHLSLVDPESRLITNIWSLPPHLLFDHLYEDDLGRVWIFTHSTTGDERPVFISTRSKKSFTRSFDLSQHIGDRGIFWDFEIDDQDGLLFIQWRLGDFLIINDRGVKVDLDISDKEDLEVRKHCSQFRLDNNNKLWRIRDMVFETFDTIEKTFKTHPLSNTFEFSNYCNIDEGKSLLNLRSLFQDSKDRIWMSFSASYLIMYDPKHNTTLEFRSPLVEELEGGAHDIRSIAEDKDGNIWGNKKGGLFKIREIVNFFESYAVNTSDIDHPIYKGKDQKTIKDIRAFYQDFAIRNTSVHSIIENNEGDLFIQDGTHTFKIDREANQIEVLPILAPKEKIHFYKDDNLSLFATWDGYYILDKNFNAQKAKSSVNKIENTFRRKNGDVWISGLLTQHEYMLGKLNNYNLEYEGNYKDPTGTTRFSTNYVSSIEEDSQERLWVGSNQGIMHFDPENPEGLTRINPIMLYKNDTIVIGKQIDQIKFIEDHLLWFKSKYEIGLLNTETQQLLRYLSIDKPPFRATSTFHPEGDSVLWLGNDEGLIHYNLNTGTSFSISAQEGLDTKGAVHVLSTLSTGELAVGTNNGIYICDTKTLVNYYYENEKIDKGVPVLLTSFEYYQGKSNQKKSQFISSSSQPIIDLAYDDRSLTLRYTLSNYNFPDRHRYTYMLEGYEADWSTPSNNNMTTYSNIPPGAYTFKVKGDIGRGIWTEQVLNVSIKVHQAWFRSWYFALGVILLLSYVIYSWTRYYFGQELEKRKSQEELRSKISSNLHDDVGTILTGIAMQAELLENFANESTKPVAQNIAERSREAMSRMRDTVWAIDSRKDTVGDLKDRMIDFLDDILFPKEIKQSTSQSYFDLKAQLNPDIRQAAYLIFKESITNVVKHSDTTEVVIDIEITKYQINFSIQDKGSEKKDIKTSGVGLKSIENRAKNLGGTFSFSYHDGYKTEVSLPL